MTRLLIWQDSECGKAPNMARLLIWQGCTSSPSQPAPAAGAPAERLFSRLIWVAMASTWQCLHLAMPPFGQALVDPLSDHLTLTQ
eukprot:193081-Prymnesium_polylepis.2